MLNEQTLKGNWNEIAGKIRSRWGQLNRDELQQYQGNVTQLVGFIQRKTGEAKSQIESYLNDIGSGGGSEMLNRAADVVQNAASRAADMARGGAEAVARQFQSNYEDVEQFVRDRPATSVATAFAAGLALGVALALLLRPSHGCSTSSRRFKQDERGPGSGHSNLDRVPVGLALFRRPARLQGWVRPPNRIVSHRHK
jgi:uncharacterized protein YjbJ (UPF0337 family)